jgi:hypothetical protein
VGYAPLSIRDEEHIESGIRPDEYNRSWIGGDD